MTQVVVDPHNAPLKTLMDIPRTADDVEQRVDTFLDTVRLIMKALDVAAELHPVIAGMGEPTLNTRVLIGDLLVVVGAFKTFYTLEMTRRGNDKRILDLYVGYVARGSLLTILTPLIDL